MTGRDLRTAALVGLGGALGAVARYGLERAWGWQPPGFPWATWVINVVGSLVIGALLVVLLEGPLTAWWVRPLVAVGLIGGFTTFSAFAVEAVTLVDDEALAMAALYLLATLVAGLMAVWISATMTRRLVVERRQQ